MWRVLRALELARRRPGIGCRRFATTLGKHTDSDSSKRDFKLSQTSVFLQTGHRIREVPLMMRVVEDISSIPGMDAYKRREERPRRKYKQEEVSTETEDVLEGFSRCFSASGIYRLLETIPSAEVTPPVAIYVLRKIIYFESQPNFMDSSSGKNTNRAASLEESGRNSESFVRQAFVNMLLEIVYQCSDPGVLLEALELLATDCLAVEGSAHKERILDEVLKCAADGGFALKETCNLILIVSNYFPERQRNLATADKLWLGILDNADELDASNIALVFETLPHLKASRDVIYKLAVDRLPQCWTKCSGNSILTILSVLATLNVVNRSSLQVISQWLKVNIHTVTVDGWAEVVHHLRHLDYINDTLIATLERYMSVRGCQMREADFIASLCDACLQFRVRSSAILFKVEDYFLKNASSLSPQQLFSIMRVFGGLNFFPRNKYEFWKIGQDLLLEHFASFSPKEVLQLLVSNLYLRQYPSNFISYVYNPYFIDRLHAQNKEDVAHSLNLLTIFIEVMRHKVKLQRLRNHIRGTVMREARYLAEILEDAIPGSVMTGDKIPKECMHPLLQSELLFIPSRSGIGSPGNQRRVAVFINTPDDMDRAKSSLLGFQILKRRHLVMCGYRVMELDFEILKELKAYPEDMKKYIVDIYKIFTSSCAT